MENGILLSVIIPVYNAEAFLDRAVQSVLCQMDGTVELILVNDGSTDQSGALCDNYAENNPNIHVIHKENGGTSSAKNMGIKAAVGEYITFMDSDDYIDSVAYLKIRNIINQYNPDCIDFGWRYVSNGELITPTFHSLPKNRVLDKGFITEWILPPLLNLRKDPKHFIFNFCCNKVFQAEIIRKNNILFDEDKPVWEDRMFLLRHLKFCETYYAMDACYYNYVDVPGSLSRRYSLDFFRIILENFKHYSELFGDQFDFDAQYVNNYWCHSIENMIYRSLKETVNKEKIQQNILQTLADPQVIHWYTNRDPQDKFERKVSMLVTSGEYKKALLEYEMHFYKKKKQQAKIILFNKFKQRIKKIIGIC